MADDKPLDDIKATGVAAGRAAFAATRSNTRMPSRAQTKGNALARGRAMRAARGDRTATRDDSDDAA